MAGGVAAFAAAVYVLHALVWPLGRGRDFESYLLYFNQIWDSPPAWPGVMLFRTPIAPLFIGGLYKLGGPWLLEVALGVCFMAAVLATYRLGLAWNRTAGAAAAVLTALYPTYASMYHLLSSDNVFACGLMLWLAYLVGAATRPAVRQFVWHGAAVFLLILTRPMALTLLVFVMFPVGLRQLDLRRRVLCAVVFACTVGVLLAAYATYNRIRYDDFTVARGGAAHVPFLHVFVVDRIVHPDNGPATRELARAIEQDLVNREPYRSLEADTKMVLESGDVRVWSDLAALSDRVWGWDSDYRMLRRVAVEAIARYPLTYLRSVKDYLYVTLTEEVSVESPKREISAVPPPEAGRPRSGRLRIPKAHAEWFESRSPRQRASMATAGPTWPSWVIRSEDFRVSTRASSELATAATRWVGNRYPVMLGFIALGLIGILFSRHPQTYPFLFIGLMAMIHVVCVFASVTLNVYYRAPWDPVFILLGVCGFVRDGFGRARAGAQQSGPTSRH